MTADQIEAILKAYKAGIGLSLACEDAGVSRDELEADLRFNQSLRSRLREAKLYREEMVESVIFNAAMEDNVPAAVAYLKTIDDRRAARLRDRGTRMNLAARDEAARRLRGAESEPSLRLLDDNQFNTFFILYQKVSAGEFLTDVEKTQFAEFMGIALASPRQAVTDDRDDEDTDEEEEG